MCSHKENHLRCASALKKCSQVVVKKMVAEKIQGIASLKKYFIMLLVLVQLLLVLHTHIKKIVGVWWQKICRITKIEVSHFLLPDKICPIRRKVGETGQNRAQNIFPNFCTPVPFRWQGSIVNVSSQASARALANHTSYGASKAAVDQVSTVFKTIFNNNSVMICQ
jgi:NAD(P)-dependent dehydrogenase (short-subunit alcohol dehydrogenase family)